MTKVLPVNQLQFPEEVLQSDIPVVIDFYATWCPPCRALAPMLDQLAEDFAGKIKFVKINSDEEQDLAGQYNVTALPTLVFINDGQVAGQSRGLPRKNELREQLTDWVESGTTVPN